jgi:hypothetical protein
VTDLLTCGKRQLDALLELEPNAVMRASVAEQLAAYAAGHAAALTNVPMPLPASRAKTKQHNLDELTALVESTREAVE